MLHPAIFVSCATPLSILPDPSYHKIPNLHVMSSQLPSPQIGFHRAQLETVRPIAYYFDDVDDIEEARWVSPLPTASGQLKKRDGVFE